MKICSTCKQEFPNGFQYCPNDTELLISMEEFVRNTKPLTSSQASAGEKVETPGVEVVPITSPIQGSAPTAQAGVHNQARIEVPEPAIPQVKDSSAGMPFRKTEFIPKPQEMPATEELPNRQPAQPPPVRPASPPPVAAASVAPSAPATAFSRNGSNDRDELSFMIPGADESFISRLLNQVQNIGDIFKKTGPYQTAEGDFHFLLEEESLATRIGREFSVAWQDFRRDPKRFLIDLVRGEGSNRTRRNMLLAGSEMALVGYATLYFISQIISSMKGSNGWMVNGLFVFLATYLGACYAARGFLLYRLINSLTNKFAFPKFALEVANWTPLVTILLLAIFMNNYKLYCYVFPAKCILPEEQLKENEVLVQLTTDIPNIDLKESATAKEKSLGGSKPKPKPASGGGGGGRQQPTPPSKGVPPQMALTPQIVMPNPEPPKIKNPSLIVAATVYGDPQALPPMKGPIGDPMGVPAPPSSGPGTGAGIGRGAGTGVGGGDGGGVGAGRGGNVGGGDMGLGGGGGVQPMSAALRPTILYKEKAKYTEEARQNKVQGTVVLNVVFTGDGRVTNIRVVRGLPDGLTEKAIEAAQKIRFRPAVKNGSPVSVRGNLEFTFNLY